MARPPLNSRLKQKIPQKPYGNNAMEEDATEYQPVKRTSGMRSSRISDSGGFSRESNSKFDSDTNSKLQNSNKATGAKPAPKMQKAQPKYKAPASYQDAEDEDINQIKPSGARGGYSEDFGDDAFEKPMNLKA